MKRPLIIHFCLILTIIGCTKSEADYGVVTFLVGDVTVKSEKGSAALKLQDIVTQGTTIKAGKNSTAAIQFGDGIVICILSECEVSLNSILEKGKTDLSLSSGTLLSKVKKLKKKESYIIKTPTMVASIRGTTFMVAHYPNETKVAVKDGLVHVEASALKTDQDVGKGKTVTVAKVMVEKEISKADALTLQMVENIPLIENPRDTSKEDMEKIHNEIKEKEKDINKQIENSGPMTLSKIRQKYGRIDVVKLFSGRVIKGAIVSRASRIRMITHGGSVSFPSDKIRNTGTE